MISRNLFTDVLLIAMLVTLQIFLFNRIDIAGKYTPVIYIIFVLFYPFYRNLYIFLSASFILGLSIDAFLGTWGINAFATTLIAYFRTIIFKTSTEVSSDVFSFHNLQWSQFLFYIFSSIFVHQLLVQSIEFFKFDRFFEVILNILVTSVISIIFVLLYSLAFKIKEKVWKQPIIKLPYFSLSLPQFLWQDWSIYSCLQIDMRSMQPILLSK